ncbi:beta-galactoside-a-2,6-sialyltransferase isoform X2 [Oratosquilla oratoria]
MRLMGLGVWLFLHLVFLGMAAYLYLLWVQYWRYAEAARAAHLAAPRNFSFSRRDRIVHDLPGGGSFVLEEVQVRKGRPLFHRHSDDEVRPPSNVTAPPATTPLPRRILLKQVARHKSQLTVQLRTAQMDGGNILFKHENKYGVKYKGARLRGELDRERLACRFKGVDIRTLRDGDEPFTSEGVAKYFPTFSVFEGRSFNTCAVVSSAASLRGSKLGSFIDSHDAVMRFNHAPTRDFEKDVGKRTTLRIVNSQVLTKPKFDFWGSSLYRDVTLLVWDPSNYTTTLKQWYAAPDFDLFPVYFRRRLMLPGEDLHLLHPATLWRLWDALQASTRTAVLPNPPSSGFLGLVLMLHHCQVVRAFEYVPSLRVTKQCHYWEPAKDSGCTFGDWHPLATEKLLTLALSQATDEETFLKGYVTLKGFSEYKCPSSSESPKKKRRR